MQAGDPVFPGQVRWPEWPAGQQWFDKEPYMLEFLILLMVLAVMAFSGVTLLTMLLVSGLLVLLGVLGGMLALLIKLAPWLLLALVIAWFIRQRRRTNLHR